MLLKLSKIRLDGGTQPRAVLNQDVINDYADLMLSGVQFPPVTVFFDGTDYWLADGFHRVGAAQKISSSGSVQTDVRQGTLQDAQWFSYSVNQSHGLRRTNGDKERTVRAALAHPNAAILSNVEIARHCGVDQGTVRKYRATTASSSSPADEAASGSIFGNSEDTPSDDASAASVARTVTRRGTTYQQKIAKIGKNPTSHVKRRSCLSGISPKASKPIRGHSQPVPKTALELPHDPEWAARTLISVFDRPFLETLVVALTKHLQGEKA